MGVLEEKQSPHGMIDPACFECQTCKANTVNSTYGVDIQEGATCPVDEAHGPMQRVEKLEDPAFLVRKAFAAYKNDVWAQLGIGTYWGVAG